MYGDSNKRYHPVRKVRKYSYLKYLMGIFENLQSSLNGQLKLQTFIPMILSRPLPFLRMSYS